MRYGVVEGEPGIFPDPIARFLRAFGRLMRRGSDERNKPSEPTDDQPNPAPDDT